MLTQAEIDALPPAERFMWTKLRASGLVPDDLDATTHYDFAGNDAGFRIPYTYPDGSAHPLMHRVRLKAPAPDQGKYTQPSTEELVKAGHPALDARHPYLNHKQLAGPTWAALGLAQNKRLLLVEGELKAVCAMKYLRIPAIGIPGCEGGVYRNERAVALVNPVLRGLIQRGDLLEVVLDGDILTNPNVNRAAGTLKRALARLGIVAVFVILPPPPSGAGGGLDDWIVARDPADVARAFDALPRTYGEEFDECHISVADYFLLAVSAKTGYALPTMSNVRQLLECHEHYRGRYFYDTMQQTFYRNERTGPVSFKESWALDEVVWLQRRVGITIPKSAMHDSLVWLSHQPQHQRNRLLEALPNWDRTPRLETMFIAGWGADDTDYMRAVGRNWLTSALARAMQPGCKVDTMLVLVGAQGIGKSRSLEAVASPDYYVQTHAQAHEKDFIMALHRGWLIDMAELSSMNHADATQIKGIITTATDKIRPPYGAGLVDMPRHSVVVGTTNEERFLRDPTGNRRFWPVQCGAVDMAWIAANREQLLAEAKFRVEAKEDYWTMPASALKVQEARMETSPLDEPILNILSSPQTMRIINVSGLNWRYITTAEILDALGIEVRFRKPHMYRDVASSIRRVAGVWESYKHVSPITLPTGGVLPQSRGYRALVTGNPTATVIDLPTKKFT